MALRWLLNPAVTEAAPPVPIFIIGGPLIDFGVMVDVGSVGRGFLEADWVYFEYAAENVILSGGEVLTLVKTDVYGDGYQPTCGITGRVEELCGWDENMRRATLGMRVWLTSDRADSRVLLVEVGYSHLSESAKATLRDAIASMSGLLVYRPTFREWTC